MENTKASSRYDGALFKCLEGCQVSFKNNKALRHHLLIEHDYSVTENQMEFARFGDFEKWLEDLEKNENVRYFKPRGTKRTANGKCSSFLLMCSRSGKNRDIPEESRKRHYKAQGTSKLNFGCTSQLSIRRELSSDKCSVVYISTHYGHDEKLEHLRVSKHRKKEVVKKLLMGVSATCVLDSVRDDITEQLHRDDILTRKDIHNIKTSFKINITEGCRHHDDATSVNLWVQECQRSNNNPVLFFKKQGEVVPDWNLKSEDFCLILMNSCQVEIFKKFGRNIICVDGTHGLNSYDFDMTIILVVDEFGEGFPVAFMFSNRKDSYIYEIFFTYFKNAVLLDDSFRCNVFMTDLANVYFIAWSTIIGPPLKQLFFSWHVDRAWQQNLSKVADPEKRKWVYKTLKYLQTCLDEDVFEKEYVLFLSSLKDQGLTNMYTYLITFYYENRFKWAYCYRKGCGINTNMHLESMHGVIKHIYLEGRKIKRLDKSLFALQKYLRDKVIERVIKLTKGKCTKHLIDIKKRHRAAMTISLNVAVGENETFLISDDGDNVEYVVSKLKSNNCCALVCTYCNICVHVFHCTCLDYSIRATICKHIHYIVINTIEGNNSVIERDNQVEIMEMVKTISFKNEKFLEGSSNSLKALKIQVETEISQLQNNLQNVSYTKEELEHIQRILKISNSLGSTSSPDLPQNQTSSTAVGENAYPQNKKIEKQSRFFSTKKKRLPKKRYKTPNASEVKVIKETLSSELLVSTDPRNDHLYT